MLAFDSLTPEALLKEVAEFLRQAAHRQTYVPAKRKLDRLADEGAAKVLTLIAQELEGAAILPAGSILREESHARDCAQRHGGECTCGAFERNEQRRPEELINPPAVTVSEYLQSSGLPPSPDTAREAATCTRVIQRRAHIDQEATSGNTFTAVEHALAVMVLNRRIREYLELYDPKAFVQAEDALTAYNPAYAQKLAEARTHADPSN
jgi:hypothetical protein